MSPGRLALSCVCFRLLPSCEGWLAPVNGRGLFVAGTGRLLPPGAAVMHITTGDRMNPQVLLRKVAVAPIRLYQYCLSPLLPKNCRFYPTCSAYALEAVMAHGLFRGAVLTLRRVLRCHPWNPGGYDPVPPARNPRYQRKR